MLTFVRTASTAPGKTIEAVKFAHQAAQMIEKLTGAKFSVSVPAAGNPMRIAWIGTLADMTELETVWKKLMSDGEYVNLVESNSPNFLPGSVHDEIWTSV